MWRVLMRAGAVCLDIILPKDPLPGRVGFLLRQKERERDTHGVRLLQGKRLTPVGSVG